MGGEADALLAEMQDLARGMRAYSVIEAAMRVRALGEIAASLGTDALLHLAAAQAGAPQARA